MGENRKGSDNLLDLEENKKSLNECKQKLKSLGDSLWHYKTRKRFTRIRGKNNGRRILEWPKYK